MENEFVDAYLATFRGSRPSIYQMELITMRVSDLAAWQETLRFWAGNDYRPQSIFKMCDYYDELLKQRRQKSSWQDVGRSDADRTIDAMPACRFCGEDICFQNHREDLIREQEQRVS
jgi:hypothetical protein